MFELIVFLLFIALGFAVGTQVEKKHYQEIEFREKGLINLPVVTSKDIEYLKNVEHAELVCGNVVISLDYFKRFLAGLRNIFGGRITAYETLLDRGRREAILRMKHSAQAKGYGLIINMRFETSSIGQVTSQKGSMGCFEVMAYGTAIKLST